MDAILSWLFSSEEQELYILDCMAYFMDFMAACTFELPSLLLPLCLVLWTSSSKTSLLPNQLLIAMFLCHYVQRTLIYPFLIRGGKATPFASFALALVFCIYNGYMQVRYLSHYAEYPADWVTQPRFIIGSALWLVGWLMNIHSDHILRNLRKPGETGYKIPRGKGFLSARTHRSDVFSYLHGPVECGSCSPPQIA
ncbi:hypothetical protein AMECASPLE_011640 [Ameca splendens]|uniref:3-oxo-5-alpha-steroid 4-dehydrogenase C-terminal domain-containing protein n=1 Tax=Ameca splendens TaxID=208324 RepID=A0ABV0Y0T5_9TELE